MKDMPDIDIHNYAQKIESIKNLVKKSRTSDGISSGLTSLDFPK